MTLDSILVRSRFHGGHVCHAYNEAAFRYFLAVERARALRSQRFLYLVLVSLRQNRAYKTTLPDATAKALLRGLHASIREIDFLGWYLEGQVAAAVLAQSVSAPRDGAASAITDRVVSALQKRLTAADSKDLRVRVVRLGGRIRT